MPDRLQSAGVVFVLAFVPQLASGGDKPRVSFERDIAPLLATKCATCHLTGQESGRLALHPDAAYASLVNVDATEAKGLKRVLPFRPAKSYMMMKLEGSHLDHGGIGTRMPQGGEPLPAEELGLIRRWIQQGAQKN